MRLLDGPPVSRKSPPPSGNSDKKGGDGGTKGGSKGKGKGKGSGTRGNTINPRGNSVINAGDEEGLFAAGKKIPLENIRVVSTQGKSKEITLHFTSPVAGNCLIKVQRSGELSSEDLELLVEKRKTVFSD